jgi:hypothetical protein
MNDRQWRATATASVVVGQVCFQEVARLISTADIGRKLAVFKNESEWQLSIPRPDLPEPHRAI